MKLVVLRNTFPLALDMIDLVKLSRIAGRTVQVK